MNRGFFLLFPLQSSLAENIKISDQKLKDENLVLEVRTQLIKDYPDSDAAPEAMFDMAEDASKSGQGNALYQKFIDTYPSHKLAKKALKELTKN